MIAYHCTPSSPLLVDCSGYLMLWQSPWHHIFCMTDNLSWTQYLWPKNFNNLLKSSKHCYTYSTASATHSYIPIFNSSLLCSCSGSPQISSVLKSFGFFECDEWWSTVKYWRTNSVDCSTLKFWNLGARSLMNW
jgi:hypothetical protein